MHAENHFRIRLRDLVYETGLQFFKQSIDQIRTTGVPNYFGPQRFGYQGKNLEEASDFFAGRLKKCSRFKRGIYLSAARACLFNQVLSKRIASGNWDRQIDGDVMSLNGTASFFKAEKDDPDISKRLSAGDIHPSGPLWGSGVLTTTGEAGQLEYDVATSLNAFAKGLENAGLKQERRALRVIPGKFSISPDGNDAVMLEFTLPRGSYATSVLREMVTASGL